MPLLDLKTDLKSLKYGQDQPGGGNSGQPYIQTDINKVDTGFNRFRMTKFDDGLVRGGFVGAANASIVDTLRIGKFLKDFPKGPLFITKQVGLQLSNPKLEHKTNFPTGRPQRGQGLIRNVINFIANTANKILNAVGPTRIYNLGINTLAQVPVNAFGQHIQRHGFTPKRNDDNLYFKVALHNNNEGNNRLTKLREILGNTKDIANYISGPSSVYGIGKTIIRRRGDFIIENQDITANEWAVKTATETGKDSRKISYTDASRKITTFTGVSNTTGSLFTSGSKFFPDGKSIQSVFAGRRDYTPLGLDNKTIKTYKHTLTNTFLTSDNITSDLGSGSNAISNYPSIPTSSFELIAGIDQSSVRYTDSAKKYSELAKSIKYTTDGNRGVVDNQNVNRFGIYGDTKEKRTGNFAIYSPVSTESPVYYNGKNIIKVNIPWDKVTREIRVGSGRKDSINLTPIFDAPAGTIGDVPPIRIPGTDVQTINDLVKFRIQALNGNDPTQAQWMIFRAYITQFSDSTDATWNPVKYVGRGEDFYIYNGFSRKISIGFKVAALSAEEMEPMYQKLNFLMGNVMPDYDGGGLMRGPLIKMTAGNWIDGQDGILTSVGYTVPNDSPWEIAINEPLKDATGADKKVLVLPHIVDVSLAFTPIGSQTKKDNKISAKSTTTSHIAQNINDYQYIK